jgi:hypothetical protein
VERCGQSGKEESSENEEMRGAVLGPFIQKVERRQERLEAATEQKKKC